MPGASATGGPRVPEEITGAELPKPILAELSTLPDGLATQLARHLVAAGQLLDEDPELAYAHAAVARKAAPRLAVVREAVGLAAYAAGRFAEAAPELRAARRMTGTPTLLPVIADCERALGRPEKALEMAASDEAKRLDAEGRIEMRLVAAGARRDLGQVEAAVLILQIPEMRTSVRLAYAYADALLEAGRRDDAQQAFARAASLDVHGETDADDRLAELEGVVFIDAEDEDAGDYLLADEADDGDDEVEVEIAEVPARVVPVAAEAVAAEAAASTADDDRPASPFLNGGGPEAGSDEHLAEDSREEDVRGSRQAPIAPLFVPPSD